MRERSRGRPLGGGAQLSECALQAQGRGRSGKRARARLVACHGPCASHWDVSTEGSACHTLRGRRERRSVVTAARRVHRPGAGEHVASAARRAVWRGRHGRGRHGRVQAARVWRRRQQMRTHAGPGEKARHRGGSLQRILASDCDFHSGGEGLFLSRNDATPRLPQGYDGL